MNFLLPPCRRGGAGAERPAGAGDPLRRRSPRRAPSSCPPCWATTGTRRYFLAFQNNAELRGSGRLHGQLGRDRRRRRPAPAGALRSAGGAERGRHPTPDGHRRRPGSSTGGASFNPGQYWQQVNVSPDFPTTARLIAELYPQSGGQPVDGVIAVDPPGLAAMLQAHRAGAGANWPVPITSDNVVDITLRQAYEAFPQDQRVAFLGDLARQVAEAFTQADLGRPAQVTAALGAAASDGHLLVWMARPEEQALMARLGIDGAVLPVRGRLAPRREPEHGRQQGRHVLPPPRALRRHPRSRRPARPPSGPGRGDHGQRCPRLRALGPGHRALRRALPAGREPHLRVGLHPLRGAGRPRSTAGPSTSRTSPTWAAMAQSTVDQHPRQVEPAPSPSTSAGEVALSDDGWYRLDVYHQTSLVPDDVEISVAVPKGWRIVRGAGARQADGDRRATGQMALDGPAPSSCGSSDRLGRGLGAAHRPVPDRTPAPESAGPRPRVLDPPRRRLLAFLRPGGVGGVAIARRGMTSVTREQMIRRAVAVTVGVVAWLALVALARRRPETALPDCRHGRHRHHPVVVDLTGDVDPGSTRGCWRAPDRATMAPMLAVYVGLSVLGLTLGRDHRSAPPAGAGRPANWRPAWSVGRGPEAEFWDPGQARTGRPAAATGPPGSVRSSIRPAMLVGSGDTVSIAEHGPPVRAGYARGATDG